MERGLPGFVDLERRAFDAFPVDARQRVVYLDDPLLALFAHSQIIISSHLF